ncbi:MAG: agmatinase [Bacteroidetes bacterium]|jgi:agmatinase|nr:agmatinase [Bacteroidota bacterium]
MRHFVGIETENGSYEKSKVLLQSIPYDGTSTWGKGADRGYEAFMDALDNMEVYDIETASEVYLEGIHVLDELKGFNSPEAMFEGVYGQVKDLIKTGKFITCFGGEHSVSIGAIKAHYEHYDGLSILQLDAHTDLRPDFHGSAYNHACAVYDASKNTNLVQVGIRSMDIEEMEHIQEGNIFWAHEMHGHRTWMQNSIDRLGDQVYITLDLDVFDPSVLPGTGTPEPGGLSWYDMVNYLRMVFEQKDVVGFDIVELAPINGHKASEFLTAKLYYKMLSYKFCL